MREVALLALIKGIPLTASILGIQESTIKNWVREINNDPFFVTIRNLIWEHLQQSNEEETANKFKLSVGTVTRLKKFMESNPPQPIQRPTEETLQREPDLLKKPKYSDESSDISMNEDDMKADMPAYQKSDAVKDEVSIDEVDELFK